LHTQRLQRSMKLCLDRALFETEHVRGLFSAEVEQHAQGKNLALTLREFSDELDESRIQWIGLDGRRRSCLWSLL
jgi:hypothetical protein